MAQTGFTPIQLYSSSTATNVPLAANLATGELAINITDGKLFYKDNTAAVQVIGWKVVPATAGGTGQTSYAVGDLLYADTTTTLAKLPDVATGNALISGGVSTAPSWGKIGLTTHVSGTLGTGNGGTNLTSFTSGGVVYASSTSALATGSVLSFDGTNLGVGTSSPSTFGKIVSYSTAAASANIALTKADSGTPSQNGQILYFNNSHAAGTGRNANVVAGQIIWQFSQPSSGALQYAGEIAVLSDAQGGASSASSLNLYSSGGRGLIIDSGTFVTMPAYGAGAATFSASGVISSVSDETWKIKDGVPTNPEVMLKKLEPGYWFYNEEKAPIFGGDRQLGFYAQNVNAAIGPEAAPTPEKGKPWGYYDRSVLAITVMSLKNALATIEELKQRITALEST